jgi:hypothetical protein
MVGAAQVVPTFYIVPLGMKRQFFEDNPALEDHPNIGVVEVDPMRPISHQLTSIPFPSHIIPVISEDVPKEDANYFLTLVYQGAIAYQITQKTYQQSMPLWIQNSLTNAKAFHDCRPINHIPHNPNKRFAVVVGNGPSVDLYMKDIPEDAEVFACWHVAKKLIANGVHIDYVVHIDPLGYEDWQQDFSEETSFIAAAQASPMFVNLADPIRLYGYFEPGNVCNAHFANHHNVPDSHHVVGAVPHCAASSAIYAGHKDIVLLGVDNAWVEGNYECNTVEEPKKVTNKCGKEIYTYSAFETEARGLYSIPALNPGVKLYQASDIALDVSGIDYKPLKDFHGYNAN